jgi:hypothetical protein
VRSATLLALILCAGLHGCSLLVDSQLQDVHASCASDDDCRQLEQDHRRKSPTDCQTIQCDGANGCVLAWPDSDPKRVFSSGAEVCDGADNDHDCKVDEGVWFEHATAPQQKGAPVAAGDPEFAGYAVDPQQDLHVLLATRQEAYWGIRKGDGPVEFATGRPEDCDRTDCRYHDAALSADKVHLLVAASDLGGCTDGRLLVRNNEAESSQLLACHQCGERCELVPRVAAALGSPDETSSQGLVMWLSQPDSSHDCAALDHTPKMRARDLWLNAPPPPVCAPIEAPFSFPAQPLADAAPAVLALRGSIRGYVVAYPTVDGGAFVTHLPLLDNQGGARTEQSIALDTALPDLPLSVDSVVAAGSDHDDGGMALLLRSGGTRLVLVVLAAEVVDGRVTIQKRAQRELKIDGTVIERPALVATPHILEGDNRGQLQRGWFVIWLERREDGRDRLTGVTVASNGDMIETHELAQQDSGQMRWPVTYSRAGQLQLSYGYVNPPTRGLWLGEASCGP